MNPYLANLLKTGIATIKQSPVSSSVSASAIAGGALISSSNDALNDVGDTLAKNTMLFPTLITSAYKTLTSYIQSSSVAHENSPENIAKKEAEFSKNEKAWDNYIRVQVGKPVSTSNSGSSSTTTQPTPNPTPPPATQGVNLIQVLTTQNAILEKIAVALSMVGVASATSSVVSQPAFKTGSSSRGSVIVNTGKPKTNSQLDQPSTTPPAVPPALNLKEVSTAIDSLAGVVAATSASQIEAISAITPAINSLATSQNVTPVVNVKP